MESQKKHNLSQLFLQSEKINATLAANGASFNKRTRCSLCDRKKVNFLF